MENSGGEIAYPTVEQICEVNRRMVQEFGGLFVPPDNVVNLPALEYILDAVRFSIHNLNIYPTLKEKAAAIAHRIISRHVFQDGNKRTACHAAWEFLRSNGVRLSLDSSVVELAVAIADGVADEDQLLEWLRQHQEE